MGATSIESPNANTSTPGSGISGLVLVTSVNRTSPAAITIGASMSRRRGPSRSASRPNRAAMKNITMLIGRKIERRPRRRVADRG